MKKLIIIFLSIVLISSCSDKEDLVGRWEDNIKLSAKTAEFEAKADSVIITTEGDWWMIDEVIFNDNSYNYNPDENLSLYSYPYAIIGDDFVVEKRDKTTLFIRLDENETGEERILGISLLAGDYGDHVVVKQSAQ